MSFTPFHRGGSGKPLVLIHGFTDTWRTWELVLPTLERRYDVLALTLAGHAGGPPLGDGDPEAAVIDSAERAMDEAGFETARIAGNSLGGYTALHLAERGRAKSVVALAPAGGWAKGDPAIAESRAHFPQMKQLVKQALPHIDAILATPEGRRRATALTSVNYEHIPVELLTHQVHGVARCDAVDPLVKQALERGWELDPEAIECPVRIVWGTEDRVTKWPSAAVRYREWFPNADWVELEGVGHAPQLDVPEVAAALIAE